MMKKLSALVFSLPLLTNGQDLLFRDNFDAPDTNNLDLSEQAGRRSGAVPGIQVRSSRIQHGIAGNQLNFLDNRTGRIRFHADPDNNNATAGTWHNWAGPATGPLVLDGGGIRVEFDWNAGNNTSENWISVNMGISGPGVGEPGFRVNHAETDVGMLFRYNGLTQIFDNGVNLGPQGEFPATVGLRHVVMDFLFNSFGEGNPVSVVASVDGIEVFNGGGFTWSNNFGELYFEIGTLENTLIDNLEISTVTSIYNVALSAREFASGAPQGTLIGELSAEAGGSPDPSTFLFVDGDGDIDNDKFQINGGRLEVGAFDFTGANSIQGQQFSVRVRGTGSDTREKIFTLVANKDDDFDSLPDAWENRWVGNLDDLSGGNSGQDFDNDNLSDAVEYEASLTYPDIDPTLADTDGDTLSDGEEINPTGDRPQTDPTMSDSDLDGLSDLVETNSGVLVDENDTGTNPTERDTDGDFAYDGWEISLASNPFDANERPGPVGPVTIVPITDDASSGIDPSKTYTHLVSGGGPAVVNGVAFATLSLEESPLNFFWDTGTNTRNVVLGNNGDWLPFDTGVGPGLQQLLGSFTYSGSGASPGSFQTYVLTGLTPGESYDLRIYSRVWSNGFSGRPIDLIFTNGSEVVQPFNPLPFDQPGIVTGSGNNNEAYFVNYRYTAQTSEMTIEAQVPLKGEDPSGSHHLYALTNEVSSGVLPGGIRITAHTLQADGGFLIEFTGKRLTSYQVTRSTSLEGAFVPLDLPLSVTTDAAGVGQAVIPASERVESRGFYRLEEE